MSDVMSRRGIVGLVAMLAGGGAKAVQEQAVEAVRDALWDSPTGAPMSGYGLQQQPLNPLQMAAQVAANRASRKAEARAQNIEGLRSMSRAARRHYASRARRDAMKAHHELGVLMGWRAPNMPMEEW